MAALGTPCECVDDETTPERKREKMLEGERERDKEKERDRERDGDRGMERH